MVTSPHAAPPVTVVVAADKAGAANGLEQRLGQLEDAHIVPGRNRSEALDALEAHPAEMLGSTRTASVTRRSR